MLDSHRYVLLEHLNADVFGLLPLEPLPIHRQFPRYASPASKEPNEQNEWVGLIVG